MDGTVDRGGRSGKVLSGGGRDEKIGGFSMPDYLMRDYEALEKASASAVAEGRDGPAYR